MLQKTGGNSDYSSGGNIFQGSTTINNTGTGGLILGNNTADTWNSDVTFNTSGSKVIGPRLELCRKYLQR